MERLKLFVFAVLLAAPGFSTAQSSDTIDVGWGDMRHVASYILYGDLNEMSTYISHQSGVAALINRSGEFQTWTWKDLKIEKLNAPRIDLILYALPPNDSTRTSTVYLSLQHHETGENITQNWLRGMYPLVEIWIEETCEFYVKPDDL